MWAIYLPGSIPLSLLPNLEVTSEQELENWKEINKKETSLLKGKKYENSQLIRDIEKTQEHHKKVIKPENEKVASDKYIPTFKKKMPF